MDYDQALDLAIDLLCSMQFSTAQQLCEEVLPQVGSGDDPWLRLVLAFARLMSGRGDEAAVRRAEKRLGDRAGSVLGELTGDASRARRLRHAGGSTMRRVEGWAKFVQPVQLHGPGRLVLGEGCQFGFQRSPGFAQGAGFIDCRPGDGIISIGARTVVNNDVAILSEDPVGISIGADCLFGVGVRVFDTDAHGIAPHQRDGRYAATAPVVIGDNVFVGDGVVVLKGVSIGRDAVVAARSVVTRSVPARAIVAGNPARTVGDVRGAAARPLEGTRAAG